MSDSRLLDPDIECAASSSYYQLGKSVVVTRRGRSFSQSVAIARMDVGLGLLELARRPLVLGRARYQG
jgi:hypothetical protein